MSFLGIGGVFTCTAAVFFGSTGRVTSHRGGSFQCGCLGARNKDSLKKQRWKGTMKKSLRGKKGFGIRMYIYIYISLVFSHESWVCRKCRFCQLMAFFNETARNQQEIPFCPCYRVNFFQKTTDFQFNNCVCLCKTASSTLQHCLARRQVNSVNMPNVQVIRGFL